MYNKIDSIIEEKLSVLLDVPLINIGRAGNLLWLGFGHTVEVRSRNGETALKSYFSFDIQCSWRLTFGNNILIASRDINLPKNDLYIEDFDWDVHGANAFDKKVEQFKKDLNLNMKVKDVKADKFGGYKLLFNTGHELEVFPDDSLKQEYWRFIIFDNPSKHFIVFDE